jgi:hypothetical protein
VCRPIVVIIRHSFTHTCIHSPVLPCPVLPHSARLIVVLASWKTDAERVFDEIDLNGGGLILFDEFCDWVIRSQWEVD